MRTEAVGIPLDVVTPQSFMARSEQLAGEPRCALIFTPNPEFVVRAQHDEDFRAALREADLCLPDGTGAVVAARLLHGVKLRRLTGVTATRLLCQLAAARGWQVALLGGRPGVAVSAAERLGRLYPKLNVCATAQQPDVTDRGETVDDAALISELGTLKAKVLLVAFGAPKQELWLYRNREALGRVGVRLAAGVGGTFDYLAGYVPTPPHFVSRLGFEWLWRLMRQPRRLPRIWRAVFVFSWYVWRWRKQLRRPLRRGVTAVIVSRGNEILIMNSTYAGRTGWTLPGGGVEGGESAEAAALREAREETGLTGLSVASVSAEPYEYRWPLTWRRQGYGGKSTTIVVLRYGGELGIVVPKAEEGFTDFRWVQPSQLVASLAPIHQQLGRLALAELRGPGGAP